MKNRNRHVIFSDFDGTLYINNQISDRNRKAIQKWQDEDNLFGLVTGRDAFSIQAELGKRPLRLDFIIENNGAIVDGNTIAPISFEDSLSISQYAVSEKSQHILYFSQGKRYCLPLRKNSFAELVERLSLDVITEEEVPSIKDVSQISLEFKCQQAAEAFCKKANAALKNSYATPNQHYVDVVSKGINKASGIRQFMSENKISSENVSVIGDALNDLPMIESFNGGTLEHASPVIKEAASFVVKDVAQLIESRLK